MKSLRYTEELNKLAECGKQMRANRAEVKVLRSAINAHEQTPKKVYLGTALINLNLCVSCSKTLADKSCEQASESISQYEKI